MPWNNNPRTAKNRTKTIGRKYYKKRLIKITTSVRHLGNRSIYSTAYNRYIKIYERRPAIGEPWEFIKAVVQEGFFA